MQLGSTKQGCTSWLSKAVKEFLENLMNTERDVFLMENNGQKNGEEMNMLKNRVHAILTGHGIIIHATDIFKEIRSAVISAESTASFRVTRILQIS